MKRFYLILLLAAALCCIPVMSSAEGLDSLFEADALELEPYSWPEVRGDDLVIQDSLLGMLGGADPAMLLQGVQIVPISLSPSGTSGLFDADGSALAFYEGQYRFLIPSETRGVPDSNGNLQRLLSRPMRNWLGEEGVVYSPDGRYAAINNCQSVLKTMKLVREYIQAKI